MDRLSRPQTDDIFLIFSWPEMCLKDTDVPTWKTYTQIAKAISDADGDGGQG